MAIFAQCPICRSKQALKNKLCSCGEDLDAAKRSRRVKYLIHYRLPNGRPRVESVNAMEGLDGYSIDDARDAEAKRRVQKKENRIFDIQKDTKMTFNDLADWYLNIESVKNLKSYWLIKLRINDFNSEFGNRKLSTINRSEIEDFQSRLLEQGKAPATVDHIIIKTKTMVNKAIENDIVSVNMLRPFMAKKTLKKGFDVRDRILSVDEFHRLFAKAADHLKPIIACGYYTGMRRGEILSITWDHVNLERRIIELDPNITKDREARDVPICYELYEIIVVLPSRFRADGQYNHVFQYHGKPIKSFTKALKHACKKAEIKYGRFERGGFVFHDLRHSFNTNARKAGVSESVIMKITGHSTREMFDRYNKIDNEDTRNGIEIFENYLLKNGHRVDHNKITVNITTA